MFGFGVDGTSGRRDQVPELGSILLAGDSRGHGHSPVVRMALLFSTDEVSSSSLRRAICVTGFFLPELLSRRKVRLGSSARRE